MSGLDNVYLQGGVKRLDCFGCGERFTQIEAPHQLMEVIAVGLLLKPAKLSGQEMRFLRKSCNFSQDELAKKLGITRRAVIEREKKPRPGLRADQEMGLRVILLAGFKARLEQEGSHLDPAHEKTLEQAVSGFIDFAQSLTKQSRKQRATLTRDTRRRQWRFRDPKSIAA
jgi:DNA-binding XRE family transcriptional regulator